MTRAFGRLSQSLYRFRDTCNVYVIAQGSRALLIDIGSGAVLDYLGELGIQHVDWVLHTHHHRDQCAGDLHLVDTETRIGVPEREAHYFEDADALWQLQQLDSLYDCANLFDRPIRDIAIGKRIKDYETFDWNDLEILALPTPGHTRGSLSFLATLDGHRWGFTGDLIHSPGRLWTFHDLHWDYSNPDGVEAAMHSAQVLARRGLDRIAPSHGDVIDSPRSALLELNQNLLEFHAVTGNGFIGDIAPPMAIQPRIRELSPHLLEISQSNANFYVLRDDEGNGLFFDYGFPDFSHVAGAKSRFVEHSVEELSADFGIRRIETYIPTHYHDDHVAGAGFLKGNFGTEVWAFDGIADVLARPYAYKLPAVWGQPTAPDEIFSHGEVVDWRGYSFEARHCPGHTRYAVALFGEIDGRRVAITGDEIQLDRDRQLRGGGPVYRNGFLSSDFTTGIQRIKDWKPEVLLTGHDGAIEVREEDLDDVLTWSEQLQQTFRILAPDPSELELAIDPHAVRVDPYMSHGHPGQPISLKVEIVNHLSSPAGAELALVVPDGWNVVPDVCRVEVDPTARAECEFTLSWPDDAPEQRFVFAVDVTLGKRKLGQVTEGIVSLTSSSHQI